MFEEMIILIIGTCLQNYYQPTLFSSVLVYKYGNVYVYHFPTTNYKLNTNSSLR